MYCGISEEFKMHQNCLQATVNGRYQKETTTVKHVLDGHPNMDCQISRDGSEHIKEGKCSENGLLCKKNCLQFPCKRFFTVC